MEEQDRIKLELMLIEHEGYRQHPYKDSRGVLTVGHGRNLEANGIDLVEALYLLRNDIRGAEITLAGHPWFAALSGPRQAALIDMVVNLGAPKFAEFRVTQAALARGDYLEAGAALLSSLWARQVGARAQDIATLIITGEWPVKERAQ